MEPNSRESLPELPRPEHIDPRIDDMEVVSSPEQQEASLPKETLVRANDAVSQAISTVANPLLDDSTVMVPTPAVPNDDNPTIADDVDVIEKEWVQKAKQIVANSKEDPHKQSVQINIFKHDYMKKRYGKEIKLPEEQKGN